MKKQIFTSMAVLFAVFYSSHLSAQVAADAISKQKTKSNNTNERTVGSSSTGTCVGKIRCADGSCSITFEQEIVSPRDAASGLPTGKRMHKPFTITKELDKSSPVLAKGGSGMGAGKASFSDLSIMMNVKGNSRKLQVVNGQFTMPDDCDDDCDLVVSWSWGASQSGSSSGSAGSGISRYQATFSLEMKEGEFMASKKNYTGHVTLMK